MSIVFYFQSFFIFVRLIFKIIIRKQVKTITYENKFSKNSFLSKKLPNIFSTLENNSKQAPMFCACMGVLFCAFEQTNRIGRMNHHQINSTGTKNNSSIRWFGQVRWSHKVQARLSFTKMNWNYFRCHVKYNRMVQFLIVHSKWMQSFL